MVSAPMADMAPMLTVCLMRAVTYALDSFVKSGKNGYWSAGSTQKGAGLSLEACAQHCLDSEGCGVFEVYNVGSDGHCYIWPSCADDDACKAAGYTWNENAACKYYERPAEGDRRVLGLSCMLE